VCVVTTHALSQRWLCPSADLSLMQHTCSCSSFPLQCSDPQALSCALAALARLRLPATAADSARLAGLLEQTSDSLAAATPKQLTGVSPWRWSEQLAVYRPMQNPSR
jgi:hypothetical protein